MMLCETYYGLPAKDRSRYLAELVQKAVEGDTHLIRLFTNWVLLRPAQDSSYYLNWRGSLEYPTLPQEAHAMCNDICGKGIVAVIRSGHFELEKAARWDPSEKSTAVDGARKSACRKKWNMFLKRDPSPLTREAYRLALASNGVSVVGTERSKAA